MLVMTTYPVSYVAVSASNRKISSAEDPERSSRPSENPYPDSGSLADTYLPDSNVLEEESKLRHYLKNEVKQLTKKKARNNDKRKKWLADICSAVKKFRTLPNKVLINNIRRATDDDIKYDLTEIKDELPSKTTIEEFLKAIDIHYQKISRETVRHVDLLDRPKFITAASLRRARDAFEKICDEENMTCAIYATKHYLPPRIERQIDDFIWPSPSTILDEMDDEIEKRKAKEKYFKPNKYKNKFNNRRYNPKRFNNNRRTNRAKAQNR